MLIHLCDLLYLQIQKSSLKYKLEKTAPQFYKELHHLQSLTWLSEQILLKEYNFVLFIWVTEFFVCAWGCWIRVNPLLLMMNNVLILWYSTKVFVCFFTLLCRIKVKFTDVLLVLYIWIPPIQVHRSLKHRNQLI